MSARAPKKADAADRAAKRVLAADPYVETEPLPDGFGDRRPGMNGDQPYAREEPPHTAEQVISARPWPSWLRFDEIKVPPFPLSVFSRVPWLREHVEDVAGFVQVHHDMPAMLMLAALSTACMGRFHVEV